MQNVFIAPGAFFINKDEISGEDHAGKFENRPQYVWLVKNAGCFGFIFSSLKNSPGGMTFEPWYWRWRG